MKYLRRFLLYPLLLILLLAGGIIGYVVGTQSGLRTTLGLVEEALPGQLKWASIEGKLAGPLDIQSLTFEQPDGIKLSLEASELRWKPSALLGGKLLVDKLHLRGLEIYLPPSPETEAAETKASGPVELPDINLPLNIALNDIDLSDIRVFPHGATDPIVIDHVRIEAAGENEAFRLVDLDIQTPEAKATVKGYVQPQGDYPLDLTVLWAFENDSYGKFTGDGSVQGSLADLDIDHTLAGALEATIKANIKEALNAPQWDANINASSKNLGVFSEALEQSPLNTSINTKGTLKAFEFDGRLDTHTHASGPVSLSFKGQGNPTLIKLQKSLLNLESNGGQLELMGNVNLKTLAADITGQWETLAWPVIAESPDYTSPRGTLAFVGTAEAFNLDLNTRLDGTLLQPLTASVQAERKNQVITLNNVKLKSDDDKTTLLVKGDIDLKQERFDLDGNWSALSWPMQGKAEYSSPAGDFKAAGRFDDYRFTADAALQGEQIPNGQWNIEGTGDTQQLNTVSVTGDTLGGKVSVNGKAQWAPKASWDVTATTASIDPGQHWPSLPGNIDLEINSSGKITDDGPQLIADITQLSGQLQQKPLKGQGQVEVSGDIITVNAIRIESLGSQIHANGVLGEELDLTFDVSAPSLEPWGADLGGAIRAKGTISGSRDFPRSELKLEGSEIKAADVSAQSLAGDIKLDLSGAQQSVVQIQFDDISVAEKKWTQLLIKGDGTPTAHQLNIALQGDQGDISSALAGGLKEQIWTGALNQLKALGTQIGDWELKQPSKLSISAQSASSENICLVSEPSELCLKGQWNSLKGATGQLRLSELNPERFKTFLPEEISLNNRLKMVANGGLDSKNNMTIDARVDLASGALTINTGDRPANIELGVSKLEAQLRGEKLTSTILLDIGSLGGLQAAVDLNGLGESGRLSGKVSPNFKDLSIVPLLAPQLQDVSGTFTGELLLGGTLGAPQITGQLDLEKLGAEIPQVALVLENTELHLKGEGNAPLSISGKAQSGGGDLAIEGQLDPRTQAFNLDIKGSEFVVADSQTLQAVISPDLKIAMNQDGMSVKGKVTIPRAFIDANGTDSGISTVEGSSDVIIIDKEGQRQDQTASNSLDLDVQVELGDDIKVEAGQFSGQLKGNLQVQQSPQLAPRGTGTIEVVSGDYVIYGQQLNIQRGRILFSGGPVDNPQLDMDVARRVEAYDVLAGARIRGNAQSPLLQLYSEPAMPDASVLSYILIGQPPGTKGGSYTLGKFLTPDLYVSYGIGLFNAINTFNMRYRLTEKLSLQAASGLGNSADLIYNIDR